MKRKVQAQRKFAQGAPIPANNVSSSERKIDTTPNKEDQKNVVCNNTAAKALLDIISFKQIHKHKRPVVLLERLRTDSVNSHIVQRQEQDEEPQIMNDTDISNSTMENLIPDINEPLNVSSNTNSLDGFTTENIIEPMGNNNFNIDNETTIGTNKNTMRLRSHNRVTPKKGDDSLENNSASLTDESLQITDMVECVDAMKDKVNDKRSFSDLTHTKPMLYPASNFSCDMSDISLDEDKPLAQYVERKKLSVKPNIPRRKIARVMKHTRRNCFALQRPKLRKHYDNGWRKIDQTSHPKRLITPPRYQKTRSSHEREGGKNATAVPVTVDQNKKRQKSEIRDINTHWPAPVKKRKSSSSSLTLQSPESDTINMVASLTRLPLPSGIVNQKNKQQIFGNSPPPTAVIKSEDSKLPCPIQDLCSFANVIEAPLDYITNRCEKCTHCIKLHKFIQIRVMVDITKQIFKKYSDCGPTYDEEGYFRLINLWDDWLTLDLDIIKEPKNYMLHVSYLKHQSPKRPKPTVCFSLVTKVSMDEIPVEAPVSKAILEYLDENFIITTNGVLNFLTYSENIYIANSGMHILKKREEIRSNESKNLTILPADDGVSLSPRGQQMAQINSDGPLRYYYTDAMKEVNSYNNSLQKDDNPLQSITPNTRISTQINNGVLSSRALIGVQASSGVRQEVVDEPDGSSSFQGMLRRLSDPQKCTSLAVQENEINNTCNIMQTNNKDNIIYPMRNAGNTLCTHNINATSHGESNRSSRRDFQSYEDDGSNEKTCQIKNVPNRDHPFISSNKIVKLTTQTQVTNKANVQIDIVVTSEARNPNNERRLLSGKGDENLSLNIYEPGSHPVNVSDMGYETCSNSTQVNNMNTKCCTTKPINYPNPTSNINASKNNVSCPDFAQTSQSESSSHCVSTHPSTSNQPVLSRGNKRRPFCNILPKNRGALQSTTQSQPSHGESFLEAPVYYPTPEEFEDPIAFFDAITAYASKFGICKVVPPKDFRPSCSLYDEMNFCVTNQYISRLYSRWGPGSREMSAIKAYLASQSVFFKRAPLYEGMEVNLPKLYQIVQRLGGLNKVIERKRWSRVAEELRFTKGPNPEKKLDQFYVKYLLPYDTLSALERGSIMSEVERTWCEKYRKMSERAFAPLQRQYKILGGSDSSGSSEDGDGPDEDPYITGALSEAEECVMQGRKMNLTTFRKVATNAWDAFFENTAPSTSDIEEEYWRLVLLAAEHLCVITASVDTGSAGYGFPTGANEPFANHPWNLKNLATNENNILRYLGQVLGVTLPTLHLEMVFSTSCWHSDPHGLPWMEYMHSGPTKIWYGIPGEQSQRFRRAVESLCPATCQNKTIWLPSDIAMIPPNLLREQKVTLCRLEQNPGEYVFVFPKAYSSSISTGYTVSESAYFASRSWLMNGMEFFMEAQTSCEPTMVSMESLLMSIVADKSTPLAVLQPTLVLLSEVVKDEISKRSFVEEELHLRNGFIEIQFLKHPPGVWNVREQYECEVCLKSLFLSRIRGLTDTNSFICLEHAVRILNNKSDMQLEKGHYEIHYFFTAEELSNTLRAAEHRMFRMT